MVQWCNGAVMQWCSDAVVQWCSGAVVQWCSGAAGKASDFRLREPGFESYAAVTNIGQVSSLYIAQVNLPV